MAYSTINKSKYGKCSSCGHEGDAVKHKRDLLCFRCNDMRKGLEQIERADKRNALRKDGAKLRGLVGKGENDLLVGRQQLIQDLDVVASRYIRILYANERGEVKCYTCQTVKHFSLMQAGHFVSRSHIGLRWDLKNLKPQDEYCNCLLHGNLSVYREELEKEQPGLPDALIEQSHTIEKPSNDELKMLLIELRAKLKNAELKLKK